MIINNNDNNINKIENNGDSFNNILKMNNIFALQSLLFKKQAHISYFYDNIRHKNTKFI